MHQAVEVWMAHDCGQHKHPDTCVSVRTCVCGQILPTPILPCLHPCRSLRSYSQPHTFSEGGNPDAGMCRSVYLQVPSISVVTFLVSPEVLRHVAPHSSRWRSASPT